MANDKYVARLQQKYVDEVAPALFKNMVMLPLCKSQR